MTRETKGLRAAAHTPEMEDSCREGQAIDLMIGVMTVGIEKEGAGTTTMAAVEDPSHLVIEKEMVMAAEEVEEIMRVEIGTRVIEVSTKHKKRFDHFN